MLKAGVGRNTWFAVATLMLCGPVHAAHLNAPLWDVFVVDDAGVPIAGLTVTEDYQDYSCEADSHLESLVTDSKGHVQFPSRYERRNPIRCIKETASNLQAGVHASLGRHASVWVGSGRANLTGYALDKHNYQIDWKGAPKHMTSTIVARTDSEWKRRFEEEKAQQKSPTP
jgi:hypothetical protein